MRKIFNSHRWPGLLGILLALAFLPGPVAVASSPILTTAARPLPASLAWGWPLAGKIAVVRAFDPPARRWLSGHRGVDLASTQGSAVMAPTNGVVSFSGMVVDRTVLTITAPTGLRLSFEPVNSTLQAGDTVTRGQTVGIIEGRTHCGDAPGVSCLHWGVRRGEEYLDPLQFLLDMRPSILLPLRSN